jgi:hypothetical protein
MRGANVANKNNEAIYGLSDIEYNIVMTLGNLLQGIEKLEEYAGDAEAAGDSECATVFRTIRESNRAAVTQLRTALSRQLK